MRNQNVPIIPGHIPFREGPVDQKEFAKMSRERTKKILSLDLPQMRILSKLVFPYWENYLKTIVHPLTDADILNLEFGWVSGSPLPGHRVVQVSMETKTSIDLFPEKIIFRVELGLHNHRQKCLIIHEGRGRFEIAFQDQEHDGLPQPAFAGRA